MSFFKRKSKQTSIDQPQSRLSNTNLSEQLYSTAGEYGLKYIADPQNADVDIVFVHGLTGNRLTTWRGKVFWPQAWIPLDLPRARVITFGYDADIARVLDNASQNSIRDHGKDLALTLGRRRYIDGNTDRPLFFVAHSLGGLVIEQALLISRGASDLPTRSLLTASAGIVFMSTPHAGSNLAEWSKILTTISRTLVTTNKPLVDVLRPGSEMLRDLQEEFHGLLSQLRSDQKPVPRIFCFHEDRPYRFINASIEIVPKYSAVLSGYPSQAIYGDHISITKFDAREDAGYQALVDVLKIWIKELRVGAHQGQTSPQILSDSASNRKVLDIAEVFHTPPINPHFIGRNKTIERLKESFNESKLSKHLRLAIHGFPGVGKSQLAIEVMHQIREQWPETSIIWIYASSRLRVFQGCQKIKTLYNLSLPTTETDPIELVFNWLSNFKNPWLLVLDNVDEDETFMQSSLSESQALFTLLPSSRNGTILVTSRNRTAAGNLVGFKNIITITAVDEQDAMAILATEINFHKEEEWLARILVQTLHCLPLAIRQAGAFIANRSERCSIRQYLELFNANEVNQIHLLENNDVKDIRRDPSSESAMVRTLVIVLEYFEKTFSSKLTLILLSIMSLLDDQAIPEQLLRASFDQALAFETAVAPLFAFALIQQGEKAYINIHQFVRLATVAWMKTTNRIEISTKLAMWSVAVSLPSPHPDALGTCLAYLPHVDRIICYDVRGDSNAEKALLTAMDWAARVYRNLDQPLRSVRIAQMTPNMARALYGSSHHSVYLATLNLADALYALGEYDEAQVLFDQLIRSLRSNDFVMSNSVLDIQLAQMKTRLAITVFAKGQVEEAITYNQEAYRVLLAHFGPDHRESLSCLHNAALFLCEMKKPDDAIRILERVLDSYDREEINGLTLAASTNLAARFLELKRFDLAEPYARRALDGSQSILGEHHSKTLMRKELLAEILFRCRKYKEAEDLVIDMVSLGLNGVHQQKSVLNALRLLWQVLLVGNRQEEILLLVAKFPLTPWLQIYFSLHIEIPSIIWSWTRCTRKYALERKAYPVLQSVPSRIARRHSFPSVDSSSQFRSERQVMEFKERLDQRRKRRAASIQIDLEVDNLIALSAYAKLVVSQEAYELGERLDPAPI